ncbi:NHL repeat-containing protein [Microlunatus parietis]|uniref:Uncharacterized protein n=1 Tax=Microlunatus parietis TaxID=682979 RepID=A0A7Y9IFD1_9ACTN|nr:hypothetical protein [Microlunatus parietis]NYE75636.1 hypothetical protein [Microlunatus parietis]
MRNRPTAWLAVACATLCLTLSLPTAAVAETAPPPIRTGDLLVPNHSFEADLDGWTPTDGRGGAASCPDGLTITGDGASDGSKALALGSRGCANLGARSDAVPVTAGSALQARAHATGTDTAAIGLVWLDAAGAVIDTEYATHPRGTEIVTVDGTAPAGAAGVAVELGVRRSGTYDEVLITAPATSVGPQITKPATYLAMGAGEDETGRKVTYSVATGSTGSPAKLVISDILRTEVIKTVDLPGATGSWTVKQNPVSKIVYIGTYGSAALWSWTPGAAQAVRIGTPPIDHFGFVYGISFGTDGTVYGGGWGEPTNGYAGAAIWKYDPEDGFAVVGPNPLTTDANYTRWTAYDQVTDAVFTGTGTKPHLYGCPVDAGATGCSDLTSLLSPAQLALPWLYGGSAGDGYVTVWGGDSNSRGNDYLTVIKVGRDAAGKITGEVVTEIKGVIYNGATRPVDGKIYFNKAGEPNLPLHSYDLATGEEAVLDAPVNIFSRAWELIDLGDPAWPGLSIVGWNSGGILTAYNLQTGNFQRGQVPNNPPMPIASNSLALGADGRLWTAGYLTGGLGAYTPLRDDRQRTYLFGGQAEQMITYRGRTYQGTYPNGRIDSFTPAEIEAGTAPRQECTIGDHQNRPYGLTGHGDRIYYGSQADYGHDQGGFGYLDLETGTCTTLAGVIGHQSISALAASGSKVFGGGSIFYAYDGEPIDSQAKLLIFDETTGEARTVPWPIAGTRSVDAALTDETGVVWFYANGWLAALDPGTEKLIFSQEIFPDWKPGVRIPGNYARLVRHPNGTIYGIAGGRLFGFDPKRTLRAGSATATLKVLRPSGAGTHLVVDDYGDLYSVAGPRLLRTVVPR